MSPKHKTIFQGCFRPQLFWDPLHTSQSFNSLGFAENFVWKFCQSLSSKKGSHQGNDSNHGNDSNQGNDSQTTLYGNSVKLFPQRKALTKVMIRQILVISMVDHQCIKLGCSCKIVYI